tara:strand:- start:675 stop:815 length:141 start_codon:yes stop_codon:yes gene_type:complete
MQQKIAFPSDFAQFKLAPTRQPCLFKDVAAVDANLVVPRGVKPNKA